MGGAMLLPMRASFLGEWVSYVAGYRVRVSILAPDLTSTLRGRFLLPRLRTRPRVAEENSYLRYNVLGQILQG